MKLYLFIDYNTVDQKQKKNTQVLEPAYLPRNDNLAFFTMSVLEQQEDGEVQLLNSRTRRLKDLVFLYRLVPGAVGPSFGVHCAQLSNMPEVGLFSII